MNGSARGDYRGDNMRGILTHVQVSSGVAEMGWMLYQAQPADEVSSPAFTTASESMTKTFRPPYRDVVSAGLKST